MKTPTATPAAIIALLPLPAYAEAQMDVRHDRITLGWDGLTPDGFETPILACEPTGDDAFEALDEMEGGEFPDFATLRWTIYDSEVTEVHEVSDLDETATAEEVVAWAAPLIRKHFHFLPRVKG